MADSSGRLAFREGALVTAVRQGHWVVLDELNLAPSDVLEALNRWSPCPCVWFYVQCWGNLEQVDGCYPV